MEQKIHTSEARKACSAVDEKMTAAALECQYIARLHIVQPQRARIA
jgi:hypothetical protein